MRRIVADFERLTEAESFFRRSIDELDQVLADLDTDLRPMAETWAGDASEAFTMRHRRWRAAAEDMKASLAELRKIIVTAHGNFRGALTANLRIWRAGR